MSPTTVHGRKYEVHNKVSATTVATASNIYVFGGVEWGWGIGLNLVNSFP